MTNVKCLLSTVKIVQNLIVVQFDDMYILNYLKELNLIQRRDEWRSRIQNSDDSESVLFFCSLSYICILAFEYLNYQCYLKLQ